MFKKGMIALNFGLSAALLYTGSKTYETNIAIPEYPKTQTNLHPIRKDIREKISSSLHQGYNSSEIDTLLQSDRNLRTRLMSMGWYQHYSSHNINEGILLTRMKEIQKIESLFCKFPDFFEYFEALPDFQMYLSASPFDTTHITLKKVYEHYRVFIAIQQYDPEGYINTVSRDWWWKLPPDQQLIHLQANEFMLKTIQKNEKLDEIIFRYGLTFGDWQKEGIYSMQDNSTNPSYGAILYEIFCIFQILKKNAVYTDATIQNDIKIFYSEKMSYSDLKNLARKLNNEQGSL